MKNRWIGIIVTIIVVALIGYVIYEANVPRYFGPNMNIIEEPIIKPNDWQPYKSITPEDSIHILKVTWAEKYGENRVVYCKAVFKNDKEKQYKMVAPWMNDVEIERTNMNDITFEILLKSSVSVDKVK